jgi:ligand-binding sensor domain-containing protein/signal transduction histidine kinase
VRTKPLNILALLCFTASAWALNPQKRLTQFTRTVWTQEHGLPQDTIRAIAQTGDGYLWMGTEEGLARFDGYDFTVFTKDKGDWPGNAVTALSPGRGGALWIGTPEGLVCYRNKRFTTYTTKDGLADKVVYSVIEDHDGAVWVASGVTLTRMKDGTFRKYGPEDGLAIQAARVVYEDREGQLWVAGYGGVAKLVHGRFLTVIGPEPMAGYTVSSMLKDTRGNLWISGSKGLLRLSPDRKLRSYDERDGLPDRFVRSLRQDRDGSLWAGTNGGLSRLEGDRFVSLLSAGGHNTDWVRCIHEDREGNLWVGMNSGLNRFREDIFTVFTRAEGLPSDEPTTVYQDRAGNLWIGFHDSGLMRYGKTGHQIYNVKNGLRSNEVFSIREDLHGDLLVGTREGLTRLQSGKFKTHLIKDDLSRNIVYDALEDRKGRLWAATPSGLSEFTGGKTKRVLPGGPLGNNAIVVLCEDGGALWAGTYGVGLWHYNDGEKRLFTTADGLSSDRIRSLLKDPDGTLWVGTFGGGLNAFTNGRFTSWTARNGLLSDNISHVENDGRGSLWLSTTRGICRVSKKQLSQFRSGEIKVLTPVNYGVKDGLRSAQCSPGSPTGGGAEATSDGRLWFPTSHGLAVISPNERRPDPPPPEVQISEVLAEDQPLDLSKALEFGPTNGRVQFRYSAIHLSAPERVEYAYRLDGLDRDWIQAGARRTADYNSLRHGNYRFIVRAGIPGGGSREASVAFRLRPHFYETAWFLFLCALLAAGLAWSAYQFRLRQIRGRFAAVLEERARLAREIHDTLAQGFVGISSQLDAVSMTIDHQIGAARSHLDLARKMAWHSLTEARRSVSDLRASALEDQDLAAALTHAAPQWTAGSAVKVEVDVQGRAANLPEHMEQHLLRIAQEAVANAVKHSGAQTVRFCLQCDPKQLRLRLEDDGKGFEPQDAFTTLGGHFGLLGMRERAQRLGGKLNLQSEPGHGTQIEVTVPLP